MCHKKIAGLADGTLKQYASRFKFFFEIVHKPLKEIDGTDIKVFLFTYQTEHKVSNITLNNIRVNIVSFFRWCAGEGYIDKDPTINIKAIKTERKKRGYLTEEEIELVRSACDTERNKALVEMLYSTGCRVSEIVALNKSDINLQTMEVTVNAKGNKQHYVYINARCKVALQRYFMSRADNSDALFVSERKPYNRSTVSGIEKIFCKLGIKAGIKKKVHPHLIRHTTATHALAHGMSIENVKQMLGHVSMDTTMIYADVANSAVKESHRKYVI